MTDTTLNRTEPIYGPWQTKYFCVKCENYLTFLWKMDSRGCCPFCGHASGSTVCATVTRGMRPVYRRRKNWLERLLFCDFREVVRWQDNSETNGSTESRPTP